MRGACEHLLWMVRGLQREEEEPGGGGSSGVCRGVGNSRGAVGLLGLGEELLFRDLNVGEGLAVCQELLPSATHVDSFKPLAPNEAGAGGR